MGRLYIWRTSFFYGEVETAEKSAGTSINTVDGICAMLHAQVISWL